MHQWNQLRKNLCQPSRKNHCHQSREEHLCHCRSDHVLTLPNKATECGTAGSTLESSAVVETDRTAAPKRQPTNQRKDHFGSAQAKAIIRDRNAAVIQIALSSLPLLKLDDFTNTVSPVGNPSLCPLTLNPPKLLRPPQNWYPNLLPFK